MTSDRRMDFRAAADSFPTLGRWARNPDASGQAVTEARQALEELDWWRTLFATHLADSETS